MRPAVVVSHGSPEPLKLVLFESPRHTHTVPIKVVPGMEYAGPRLAAGNMERTAEWRRALGASEAPRIEMLIVGEDSVSLSARWMARDAN